MITSANIAAIANNNNFKDKELLKDLCTLFEDKKEAVQFIHLYGEYCELMDDLVDEEKNIERIEKAGRLRMDISVHPYWLKWCGQLAIVERLIHNQYFDMVIWEQADEIWKRRDARALNHCAYLMLFSIILIEFGDETLKKFSLRFRNHAHERHINDSI
jgi:hypothetical protein